MSHYVGATKRTLGLVYTSLAVLYLTVFALVALLGAVNVYTFSILGALASLLIQVALAALAPASQAPAPRAVSRSAALSTALFYAVLYSSLAPAAAMQTSTERDAILLVI